MTGLRRSVVVGLFSERPIALGDASAQHGYRHCSSAPKLRASPERNQSCGRLPRCWRSSSTLTELPSQLAQPRFCHVFRHPAGKAHLGQGRLEGSIPISCGQPAGASAWACVLPTALLETRGAKSGALRRNAVIYFHDEDRATIVASKAGAERHPAWFHNLRAHRRHIRWRPHAGDGRQRRSRVPAALDARRPRLCALRNVPSRSGKGEPDDPDRPAHRSRCCEPWALASLALMLLATGRV